MTNDGTVCSMICESIVLVMFNINIHKDNYLKYVY